MIDIDERLFFVWMFRIFYEWCVNRNKTVQDIIKEEEVLGCTSLEIEMKTRGWDKYKHLIKQIMDMT